MTDEIDEQISAFIDDELSSEESAFLVRRLESDSAVRRQFIRYATIGSALRGDMLQADASLLRQRIQLSLAGRSPDSTPVPAPASRRLRVGRAAVGFGVAAVVATVALMGLRTINDAGLDNPGAVTVAGGGAERASDPASYVVPPEFSESRVVSPPIRLTNYLVQHGGVASTLSRTSIDSNVVSISEPNVDSDADADAYRQTIGASR